MVAVDDIVVDYCVVYHCVYNVVVVNVNYIIVTGVVIGYVDIVVAYQRNVGVCNVIIVMLYVRVYDMLFSMLLRIRRVFVDVGSTMSSLRFRMIFLFVRVAYMLLVHRRGGVDMVNITRVYCIV